MNQIAQAIDTIDRTAKKYKAKVSISAPGQKEVVIADHRDDDTITDSLKSLLIESVQKTRTLTDQIKEKSEELKAGLEAIPDYKRIAEESKLAAKERNAKKDQYLRRPELAKLNQEIRDLRTELKENKESQSSYASEYYRLTQLSLFSMPDGTEAEIVPDMKLRVRMPKISFGHNRHGNRR